MNKSINDKCFVNKTEVISGIIVFKNALSEVNFLPDNSKLDL